MYPCAGGMHLCHCEGVGYQSICGGLDHQEMDGVLGRLLKAQLMVQLSVDFVSFPVIERQLFSSNSRAPSS